jgi:hypothetical protein
MDVHGLLNAIKQDQGSAKILNKIKNTMTEEITTLSPIPLTKTLKATTQLL